MNKPWPETVDMNVYLGWSDDVRQAFHSFVYRATGGLVDMVDKSAAIYQVDVAANTITTYSFARPLALNTDGDPVKLSPVMYARKDGER